MVAHAARGMEPFSSLLENAVFDIGVAFPTRRRILELLRAGDMTAGELAEHFDISKPSLSHHLATLRNAGLVTDKRHGQNIVYSLNTTVMQDLVGWFNYAIRAIVSGPSWRPCSTTIAASAKIRIPYKQYGRVRVSHCVTIWRYGM